MLGGLLQGRLVGLTTGFHFRAGGGAPLELSELSAGCQFELAQPEIMLAGERCLDDRMFARCLAVDGRSKEVISWWLSQCNVSDCTLQTYVCPACLQHKPVLFLISASKQSPIAPFLFQLLKTTLTSRSPTERTIPSFHTRSRPKNLDQCTEKPYLSVGLGSVEFSYQRRRAGYQYRPKDLKSWTPKPRFSARMR